MSLTIGVDPGQNGAVATLDSEGHLAIWDMKNAYSKITGFNSLDPIKFNMVIDSAIPGDCDQVEVFCEESLLVHGNGIKTARSVFDSRGVLLKTRHSFFAGSSFNH